MRVSERLKEECCIMELAASDKEATIKEMIACLASSGGVLNEDKFVKDVLSRESLGSTGIGHTIALPHARTDAVEGFVIGFGRSKVGIDFGL